VGKGKSFETQANLRNLSGDGLLLHEGRYDLSNMQPGETRRVFFTFDVEQQLSDTEAKVEFSISDRDLRESVTEKVRMQLTAPIAIAAASGTLHAKNALADLYEAPEAGARVFGKLPQANTVTLQAKAGDFVKVGLGENRFGFARAADLDQGPGTTTDVAFEDAMQRLPPSIEVPAPVLATKDTHLLLKGSAADGDRLLDGYIFVGSRKLFYRSNRNGTDPKRMSLDADLPLRPGVNVITVVARETPDTVGRKTFIVRRDGPEGELLATPKGEEEDGAGGDD
jgi:carboxyl-terminal processing protease